MMGQLIICMQPKNWTAASLEPRSGMSRRGMREHLSRGQKFGLGGVPGQPLCVERDLFEYVDGPMGVNIIEDQKNTQHRSTKQRSRQSSADS